MSSSSTNLDVTSPHHSLRTSNVVLSTKTEISVPRMSSPLPEYLNDSVDFPSHVWSIPDFAVEASKQVSIPEMSQPLYEGAKIGRANTILLLRGFSSNANLSDANTLKLHASWGQIVPLLRTELQRQITVTSYAEEYHVKFEVVSIVADLIAKCSLLNMFQHNGYFGCNYCTIEGVTINRTHSYYPFNQDFQVRDPSINENFVSLAELLNTSTTSITNVCGVKGRSAFDGLVKGLPLSAGIDYMHCVLLGVFQDLLKFHWKGTAAADKLTMTSEIQNLEPPIELTKHGRVIRDLSHIAQFKANEFFNYLFFVAPIIFKDRLAEIPYKHLLQLSSAIRILLESSAGKDIDVAETLLDDFCSSSVDVLRSETAETINVHCLRHLAHQCRAFGPLFVFSAMSFESANRILNRCFTGTHSHCQVICRRYLEAQSLSSALPENDVALNLVREWCHQEKMFSSRNFCKDFWRV